MAFKIGKGGSAAPETGGSVEAAIEKQSHLKAGPRRWLFTVVVPLAIFSLLALIVLRTILGDPGTIGLYQDWTVGPIPALTNVANSHALQLFDSATGNKLYHTSWFVELIFVPFTGLGGEVFSKGFLFFVFVLSGMSMYALGRGLRLSYLVSILIGVIYVMSPIVFTRFIPGYLIYLLAYALFPLMVLVFIKGVEDKPRRIAYGLMGGLLFVVIGAQIQFLVMGALILVIMILVDIKQWKQATFVGVIIFVIVIIAELPWVIPLLQNPSSMGVLNSQSFLAYHELVPSPTMFESMRMIGYDVHVYGYKSLGDAGVIPGWVFVLDIAFLLVAASALLFRRDKYTIAMSLLLVIGIFLVKGLSEPGGWLFTFLFENTPLKIFRELWHIAFIPIFAGTVLIGFSLQSMTDRFSKRIRIIKFKKFKLRIPAYALAIVLAALIVVTNGFPLFRGDFAGYMQTYELDPDYEKLISSLQSDPDHYRIYWIPSIGPMGYDNSTLAGIDPVIAYSPKPTYPADVSINRPFTQYNIWITTTLQHNETSHLGALLDLTDTKKVIIRQDFDSRFTSFSNVSQYPDLLAYWDADLFAEAIAAQADLVLIDEESNYAQYLNPGAPGYLYPQVNVLFGSADLDALTHLTSVTNVTNIAYLTHYDQKYGSGGTFLAKDDPLDLVSQIVGEKIYPGEIASQLDPTIGWTEGRQWFWYDTSLAYSMNEGALAIGQHDMDMPITSEVGSELWAKVLMWDEGGVLDFKVDGRTVYELDSSSSAHYLKWVDLGPVSSDGTSTLTLSSVNGSNYVDEVMVVSQADEEKARTVLSSSNVVILLTNNGYDAGLNAQGSTDIEMQSGNPVSRSLDVLTSSPYSLWLNFTGDLSIAIGDRVFNITSDGQQLERLDLGQLEAGVYPLTITASGPSVLGDIWMTSDSAVSSLQEAILGTMDGTVDVEYQQIDATSWNAKVNASSPFMLTLAEPYDNGWVAKIGGQEIRSVPVSSMLNGFWINQTGDLTISIVYAPQQEFRTGVDIAITVMAISVAAIAYIFIRSRRLKI